MLDNDTRAQRAAMIVKVLTLARTPGMDPVAVKLNMTPTLAEKLTALKWMKAIELADGEGHVIDAAKALAAAGF